VGLVHLGEGIASISSPLPQSRGISVTGSSACAFLMNLIFRPDLRKPQADKARADRQPAPGSGASPESFAKKLRNFSETCLD
jgi:hypothetical protein